MPLDYSRAVQLFMGSEEELARALGVPVADLRSLRANPQRATSAQLDRLGRVLIERGNGMRRVGEMLVEDSTG
jgi:hypothetical protein